MNISLELLHCYFFTVVTVLFLFQSFILFARCKNNKVRKTMAVIELLWGIMYLITFIVMNTVNLKDEYMLLREKVLIIGNLFISFAMFFPIQVLIPGWLNWKRIFLLVCPVVVITVIYYGGMYFLGEKPEHLPTYEKLFASIGHFNVWFRLVMLLSNWVYILLLLWWLHGYEQKYNQWKNENFSDQEYVDISWMSSYYYILMGIFFFYLGVLLIGGRIPVLFHCSYVIIAFSYLFYKTLFYESPYPEDFFANRDSQVNVLSVPTSELEEVVEANTDVSFEKQIPGYIDLLKKWMSDEKPYLYNDFKLTDVSHVLPLNRSYLSRIFNEGFGHNFSEVVRTYRVEYSKKILLDNPAMPMYKVAELSGFHSDSSYIRAFKIVVGITPNQYKMKQNE